MRAVERTACEVEGMWWRIGGRGEHEVAEIETAWDTAETGCQFPTK